MKIWILNHYASDMYFSEGGRHYYIAKYLKKMGHEPSIFCANSKHNDNKKLYFDLDGTWEEKINDATGVPYIFVKVRPYGINGSKRILNMIDFYSNVIQSGKEYALRTEKPDIIIASSVHPLTMLAGIKLAKHLGVKCVCEVRDLWPESIVTYMTKLKRNNPIIRALYRGEKYIYRRADAIIFTMEGGYDYIREQKWSNLIPKSKIYHINNGVDLDQFEFNRNNCKIRDSDLDDESIFKVIYTGSIRKVNNLGTLLDIAKIIKNPRIRFLIWGDGDELEKLKERVDLENINNVVFKGHVDKKYIPFITSSADLNLAHNNESPIFRFGISFNKVFDYLAAGKPIICDFYAKYNPVILSGAGEYYKSNDIHQIAHGIEQFSQMPHDKINKFCVAAEKASHYYDFRNLTRELLKVIDETIQAEV